MTLILAFFLAVPTTDVVSVLAREGFRVIRFPRAVVGVPAAGRPEERAAGLYDRFTAAVSRTEARLSLKADFVTALAACPTTERFRHLVTRLSGSPPPSYAVAVAIPALRTIAIDYASFRPLVPPSPSETLGHETAHLLLHRRYRRIPRWLDEGLAMWASGRVLTPHEEQTVCYWAYRSGTIRFADLMDSFPVEHRLAAFAYLESLSVVSYLITFEGGLGRIHRLLATYQKERFGKAWRLVYGEEPEETFERWRLFQARRFSPLAFFLNELPAFTLPALLFLVAYVRYRVRRRRYFLEEAERETVEEAGMVSGGV